MDNERLLIIVDGNNFQQNLNILHPNKRLDYATFFPKIQGNRELVNIEYYISILDPKYNLQNYNKQKFWLDTIERKVSGLQAVRLPMKRRRDDTGKLIYSERGNDPEICLSLVNGAHGDRYDTAILIAADSDFIGSVQTAKNKGKRVEYVNFPKAKAYELRKTCNKSLLLNEEFLSDCWRS